MFRLTFTKALFISLIFHFFCFFAVIIVIAPVNITEQKFSKINFIGSILDKEAFSYRKQYIAYDEALKKNQGARAYKEALIKAKMPEERLKQALDNEYVSNAYIHNITGAEKKKKDFLTDIALTDKSIKDKEKSFNIESEVANREILFRPPLPQITKAFKFGTAPIKGEFFQVKLRFLVSPEGKVVFIEKLKTCGYKDIDLIATKYIQKWQFAPLTSGIDKKNQEGVLLLELKAQ